MPSDPLTAEQIAELRAKLAALGPRLIGASTTCYEYDRSLAMALINAAPALLDMAERLGRREYELKRAYEDAESARKTVVALETRPTCAELADLEKRLAEAERALARADEELELYR